MVKNKFKTISMKEALFWIRVHNLSLMAQKEYIGQMVGISLSRVEDVELDYGEVEWGEFMRIKVSIDITQPLIR